MFKHKYTHQLLFLTVFVKGFSMVSIDSAYKILSEYQVQSTLVSSGDPKHTI